MSYRLRVTAAAQKDLERLFEFLASNDLDAAVRARAAIEKAYEFAEMMPFACRKAVESNPFLRELLIPFGAAGYIALIEIEDNETVTVLAIRHQREEDFH
ncbi:MAG: type II toxin-antitoxin system RelE/ParE family toxin [Chromatiales bacterium]|nr:type II toxin-antitoxin system RelE/ParE family toxin [Gammaproteobacteria bacterium]MCP5352378.1 type II toxin-antitoxin system RelE/ParE family toxin [Chromatiales bacterium]